MSETSQKFERQECGVALVEVVFRSRTQGRKQTHAADAEHHFLLQPVRLVAAIEVVGKLLSRSVLGEVGVEQDHWNDAAAVAVDRV